MIAYTELLALLSLQTFVRFIWIQRPRSLRSISGPHRGMLAFFLKLNREATPCLIWPSATEEIHQQALHLNGLVARIRWFLQTNYDKTDQRSDLLANFGETATCRVEVSSAWKGAVGNEHLSIPLPALSLFLSSGRCASDFLLELIHASCKAWACSPLHQTPTRPELAIAGARPCLSQIQTCLFRFPLKGPWLLNHLKLAIRRSDPGRGRASCARRCRRQGPEKPSAWLKSAGINRVPLVPKEANGPRFWHPKKTPQRIHGGMGGSLASHQKPLSGATRHFSKKVVFSRTTVKKALLLMPFQGRLGL